MSTELAVTESAAVTTWTPSFAVGVEEAVAAVDAKRDFFRRVMRVDEHYGKIPGTGKDAKPTLLKPGAELLLANMGLRPELSDADVPTVDYGDDGREGLIRYRRVCRIYRQTGMLPEERMLVAQAEGSCSSRETKYRWRNEQRLCPECGKPAIIKGKAEYGGGFVCFKKKDGCGAKFRDNDATITQQVTGKIPNPDLADIENTILKMSDKRALVAATLLATGCSDMFTQDVDDNIRDSDGALEGEYFETSSQPAPDPFEGWTLSELHAEVYGLFTLHKFTQERAVGAVEWASDGKHKAYDDLDATQARGLITMLRTMKAQGAA